MPAHMIPPIPREVDEKSDEAVVFQALKKLSDGYYVFHSVTTTEVDSGVLKEREIDFVIAHKKKGILCLEAKNGYNIKYINGEWLYSSGKKMSHNGPYNQIASAKRLIMDKIKNHANQEVRKLYKKIKFSHGVAFFRMTNEKFDKLVKAGLPPEASPEITMLADDLMSPLEKVSSIMDLLPPVKDVKEEDYGLTEEEFKLLLESVLCPEFNLIPTPDAKNLISLHNMKQLLEEQYKLLDFIEDQDTAVINGAAGTGKTMIAVEKARRHSVNDEKVLFLVYNRLLCDHLNREYKNSENKSFAKQYKNVDFMTISQLTSKITGNFVDYDGLLEWLYECDDEFEKFGYKHVIIDEGQDFGIVDSSSGADKESANANVSIIDTMQEVVLNNGGTFYLFYDKYQMIEGQKDAEYKLPDCIKNSDCRLTLKRNCRNTKEIAKTSVTTLRDKKNKAIKPTTAFAWDEPVLPCMHITADEESSVVALNNILDKFESAEIDDVVILTQGKLNFSCISDKLVKQKGSEYSFYDYNGKRYKVSTCKRFKGLEAKAVAFIDLDKNSFTGKNGMEFYVGTSRAKLMLDLVCTLSTEDYADIVKELDSNAPKTKDSAVLLKILGNIFSAKIDISPVL